MNKKDTQLLLENYDKHGPEMRAFVSGEQIQGQTTDGGWQNTTYPSWLVGRLYRVKPNPNPRLKYRPLNDDEMLALVGTGVRNKSGSHGRLCMYYDADTKLMKLPRRNSNIDAGFTATTLLDYFVYISTGLPVGVLE